METHLQEHKVERNPKHESRMPKQIRMTQTQMAKTSKLGHWDLVRLTLFRISVFGFRGSLRIGVPGSKSVPGSWFADFRLRSSAFICSFIPDSVALVVIALTGLLASGVALPLSAGLEADFVSRYVWRGLALSDGPVLQPSVWVSFAGITLTPWANVAFHADSARTGLNELDLTLDYSQDILNLTVNPSLSVYLYPNQADAAPTGELALALSYPVGPVSIISDHSVDLIATPGAYFGDAGLSFENELAPNVSVEASARAGWASARFNDVNFGVHRAALNVGGVDLALNWSPAGLFYLRPHAGLGVILDRGLRAAVRSPLLISGGLAIGRDF
jgi:hypothetical protein